MPEKYKEKLIPSFETALKETTSTLKLKYFFMECFSLLKKAHCQSRSCFNKLKNGMFCL